jgi:antitoxin component of RelBE/YafQ-DinJ toxin-antitoxin module
MAIKSVTYMHISISDNLKKQFHAACALRGLKMSQVVTGLIEQWLRANDSSTSSVEFDESMTRAKVPSNINPFT